MTNETPQPNTDIRRQSCMEIPVFIDFSGEDSALITVWLEDRASYLQPEAQHLVGRAGLPIGKIPIAKQWRL
jgi:hypothetical protein